MEVSHLNNGSDNFRRTRFYPSHPAIELSSLWTCWIRTPRSTRPSSRTSTRGTRHRMPAICTNILRTNLAKCLQHHFQRPCQDRPANKKDCLESKWPLDQWCQRQPSTSITWRKACTLRARDLITRPSNSTITSKLRQLPLQPPNTSSSKAMMPIWLLWTPCNLWIPKVKRSLTSIFKNPTAWLNYSRLRRRSRRRRPAVSDLAAVLKERDKATSLWLVICTRNPRTVTTRITLWWSSRSAIRSNLLTHELTCPHMTRPCSGRPLLKNRREK